MDPVESLLADGWEKIPKPPKWFKDKFQALGWVALVSVFQRARRHQLCPSRAPHGGI